jgi:hypothetical protein
LASHPDPSFETPAGENPKPDDKKEHGSSVRYEYEMWKGWPPQHFGRIIVSAKIVDDHMLPSYTEAFDFINAHH